MQRKPGAMTSGLERRKRLEKARNASFSMHFSASGREEEAKNFMVLFTFGSLFVAAGVVFVISKLYQ